MAEDVCCSSDAGVTSPAGLQVVPFPPGGSLRLSIPSSDTALSWTLASSAERLQKTQGTMEDFSGEMPSKLLPKWEAPAPPPLNQHAIYSEIEVVDDESVVPSEHAPVFVVKANKSRPSDSGQQVLEWPSSMSVDSVVRSARSDLSVVGPSQGRCYHKMSRKALDHEFAAMCKETESIGHSTLRRQIYMSSQVLLITFTVVVVSRVVVLIRRILEKGDCHLWSSRVSSYHRWLAIGVESVWCVLLFLGIAAVMWMHRPHHRHTSTLGRDGHHGSRRRNHRCIHIVIVFCCSVYVMAFPLLPTEASCSDTATFAKCSRSAEAFLYADTLDCEMLGSTAVMGNIVLLLVAPHVFPTFRDILALPALLVVFVILCFASFYRFPVEDQYFKERDIICPLLILSIVVLIAIRQKRYMMRHETISCLLVHSKRQVTTSHLRLLRQMVPEHLVTEILRVDNREVAEQVDRASVLCIAICNFDSYASCLPAAEVLSVLNNIYAVFDSICEHHQVTKIMSIREEYQAVAGVIPSDIQADIEGGHDEILGRIICVAASILALQSSVGMQFRMGLHTGPLVAGVVGHELPFFGIFGHTVNTAHRLMHKGVDGKLQFTEATRTALPPWVSASCHGSVALTGNETVTVYRLETSEEDASMAMNKSMSIDSREAMKSKIERVNSTISMAISKRSGSQASSELAADESVSSNSSGFRATVSQTRQTQTQVSFFSSEMSETVRVLRAGMVNSKTASLSSVSLSTWFTSPIWFVLRRICCRKFGGETWLLPEEQEEWLRQFYDTRLWGRLAQHTKAHAAALVLFTLAEGLVAEITGWPNREATRYGAPRLAVFLAARGILFVGVVAFGRFAPKSKLVTSPRAAETLRLFGLTIVFVILYISYDALAWIEDDVSLRLNTKAEAKANQEKLPFRCEVWVLLFAMCFASTLMTGKLRFVPTLFMVILSMAFILTVSSSFMSPVFGLGLHSQQIMVITTSCLVGLEVARHDEQRSRKQYQMSQSIAFATSRLEGILSHMMPRLIFEEMDVLNFDVGPLSHRYMHATVVRVHLVGLTALVETVPAKKVVAIIGELFRIFDSIAREFDVYKVETARDDYLGAQGDLPLTKTNRPLGVVIFAWRVVEAMKQWRLPQSIERLHDAADMSLSCRAGVHTGECLGGTVGERMQRYQLFGRLLSEVEMLEATAPPGVVQLSDACKQAVAVQIQEEGVPSDVISLRASEAPVLETSKGETVPYELVGGMPTHLMENSSPKRYLASVNERSRR
eukprot:TRINITY_DN34812_c0_g1_i1.p1 TRINITY_DN34812_c0_g1~~TRINITY_DN34812_c0_g1_i1.p1  ORF type:complete len:1263 (-),score=169.44 TRINITY_DN34812_c0_g1_i1:35-3823(-)